MKRWAPAAFVVVVAAATLWGKSAYEAATAFAAAETAERAGDAEAARARYDEARLWRCPLCPWASAAEAALSRLGEPPRAESPAPWLGRAPRSSAAALAGIGLIVALATAARWATRGVWKPWAFVTLIAAIATVVALGAA